MQLRYLTGNEPVEVSAMKHQPHDDPRFREVAESISFILRFDGVQAHCSCSFGTGENRFYSVECADGVIELDNAFAYQGQELHLRTKDGNRKLQMMPVNHFAAEMDHFAECILNNKPPRTPGEDGLADIQVIKAIHEAAITGRTIKLST